MKYKIEKQITRQLNQTGADYSIAETVRYYIKYQKKWFGIFKYWKFLTQEQCGMGDCYDTVISFRSLKNAEEFAEKYLCKGITTDTVTVETIKEFQC